MNGRCSPQRLLVAVAASLLVGAAFLAAWMLTHGALPEGTIVVPRDATTVAAAVALAGPNGSIALDARYGPYTGPLVFDQPGLRVRSLGRRAVIDGGGSTAVLLVGDGAVLEGVTIRAAAVGLSITGTACLISGVVVEGCATGIEILDGAGVAIVATEIRDGVVGIDMASSGHSVRDASLSGMSDVGVRLRDASNVSLAGARLSGCAIGVQIEGASGVQLDRVHVRNADRGVDVSSATNVRLHALRVVDARVGLSLDAVDDVLVDACRLDRLSDVGAMVAESSRVRIAESAFGNCRVGISVSGKGGNSVVDCTFADSIASSIELRATSGDLVARNAIRGGTSGIWLDRVRNVQILRNRVDSCVLVGILLDRVEDGGALDNVVRSTPVGLAILASGGIVVRRNDVRGASSEGFALWNGSLGNVLVGNRVSGGGVGAVVAGASRETLVDNDFISLDVGVRVHRIGLGVRLEGNRMSACGTGIVWDDAELPASAPLAALGFVVDRTRSAVPPLVAGNVFSSSSVVDIDNRTDEVLFAAGNRWTIDEPHVRGRVSAPEAGDEASVAIATGTSTTDILLGRLLQGLLVDAGIGVIDLVGAGAEDVVERAVADGDADVAWWSGAGSAPGAVFVPIPARRTWTLVVAPEAVERGAVETLAVPVDVPTELALAEMAHQGMPVGRVRIVQTAGEAETLLKFGDVEAAVLDGIEETLTLVGYPALGGSTLPSVAIGLGFSGRGGVAEAAARQAFERLRPLITDETLRLLVSRVRLMRRDPYDVAVEFLLKAGWMGELAGGGT